MRRLGLQLCLLHGRFDLALPGLGVDRTGLRLTPRRPATCAERFALMLLDLIASGRIPAGARLPTERAIAERMQLSRACVRSALDELKHRGFIRSLQGSANRVLDGDEPGGALIAELGAAHRQNRIEVARLRCRLDPGIARLAAARAGAAEAAGIASAARGARPRGPRYDDTFYAALVRASRNVILGRIMDGLAATVAASEAAFDAAAEGAAAELRPRIADAIARHDAEAAASWMARYAERVAAAQGRGGAPRDHADDVLDLLTPLPRATLSVSVSARMLEFMRVGNLQKGDALPSERILADAMGISRVSVRSALQRLKSDGWIAAVERDHTRVVSLPAVPDHRTHSHHRAVIIDELYGLRSVLEGLSAEMAAEAAGRSDLEAIDTVMRETKRSGQTQRRLADLDIRFHHLLARASGSGVNIFLNATLSDYMGFYFDRERVQDRWTEARDREILDHHQAIAAAVRAGDPAGARTAMERHMRSFGLFYRIAPERIGAREGSAPMAALDVAG